MSEPDKDSFDTSPTPSSQELDEAKTKTSSQFTSVPRADKKEPAAQDQSKVISIKRRSVKLTAKGESASTWPTIRPTVRPAVHANSNAHVQTVSLPVSQPQALKPHMLPTVPVAAPPSDDKFPGQLPVSQSATQPLKIEPLGVSLTHGSNMLPLIDRMEQQINKVTSNLMARVEQALAKLEEDAEALEKKGIGSQEYDQKAFSKWCDTIISTLDHTSEDARSKVLDRSTTGQRSIQTILETGQTTIDQQSKDLMDSLLQRSKGLRIEHGQLAQVAQKKFSSLVKQRASDVHALIEMIKSDWEKLTATELQALEERQVRAINLLTKEMDSINSTFDQYCQSLERDIDEAWEQSSYEIDLTQKQCIAAAVETLRIWQQRLILLTKSVVDSEVVPRLKELRDKLDNEVEELRQQFSVQYESDRTAQLNEIEAETNELKRQYRLLASETESAIYDTIVERQAGISQLFIKHRDDIQALLRNTEDELETMHAKLKKSDASCRKLLISSAATLGLNLVTDRENLISNLQELRRTTLQSMDDRLHQDIATLEDTSKNQRSALAQSNSECVRAIKEKCRTAIAEIQAEVEQSFREIQQSREKFLQ